MNFRDFKKRLLNPGETLSERVVHGGFWVFSLRIVNRVFGFIRTIILARLLAPEDFGLFGIALLALSTIHSFTKTGFDAALIQKKENTDPYLNTAWTVQIIRGTVIAAILFVGAPLVGTFFEEPRAIMLTRVLALCVFIFSFRNIGIVYFKKNLEFHKQFTYEFSGTLADIAVAIPAALILKSVWALVFGLLARNIVCVILSFKVHSYRPYLKINISKAGELFHFGKWIFGSSILVFLKTKGDDIFVGKILGTASLGFYQMAYRISNLPVTEITHIITKVTYPAYSKLQDNLSKLKDAYLKVLQITTFISFPITGLIIVLAPIFTVIFMGEKWMPMVPAIQVLAIFGLLRSIGANTGPLFRAVGKPKIATIMQLLSLLLIISLIWPFTKEYGFLGTAIVITLTALIIRPITNYFIIRILKCRYWEFWRNILYPFLGMVAVCSTVFLLQHLMSFEANIFSFLFYLIMGIFTYFVVMFIFCRYFNYNIVQNIYSLFENERF